jgi:cell division topological specificity factor
MSSFFDRLTGRNRKTASAAKERLQLVLIHDRADLSPGVMNELRNELIDVISRYIDIDASNVSLEMNQQGREQKLIANIPLQKSRRR